jgi:hypothetical protein
MAGELLGLGAVLVMVEVRMVVGGVVIGVVGLADVTVGVGEGGGVVWPPSSVYSPTTQYDLLA